MQQKTTGNGEARMSRQDKVVLTTLALDILIIFIWSLVLHIGPSANNTEIREKKVFHSTQMVQLPIDFTKRKAIVSVRLPFYKVNGSISNTAYPVYLDISGNQNLLYDHPKNNLEFDHTAKNSSIFKTTNAIHQILDEKFSDGKLAAMTFCTTTTTTATTSITSTTTVTTTVETTVATEPVVEIIEEVVPEIQVEQENFYSSYDEFDSEIVEDVEYVEPEEIVEPINEPVESIPIIQQPAYAQYVTYTEYLMICNVVGHEYGSDYISIQDKALVAEVIMNRVYSSSFPSTVEQVLVAPYQFSGAQYWSVNYAYQGAYAPAVTASVISAVDYYFEHISEYQHGYLYFYGDGRRNYFY